MNGQHEMANIKPPLLLLLASRTKKKALMPTIRDAEMSQLIRVTAFFLSLKLIFFFASLHLRAAFNRGFF